MFSQSYYGNNWLYGRNYDKLEIKENNQQTWCNEKKIKACVYTPQYNLVAVLNIGICATKHCNCVGA